MQNRKAKVQIIFRVTEEEAEQIKAKVKESGLSQKDYFLKTALGRKIQNTDGVKAILPELKRIGNNLNQVAKHMNEGNYPMIKEVQENQKELAELWQQLRQYLQKHR
ncbi:MAG: MobC family plasmid mobilization relaxosome protein [Butyrivibrio sp.]|nr:MobC family plasmid mobilization relaxosome protein [Butyrivibrio sp.]